MVGYIFRISYWLRSKAEPELAKTSWLASNIPPYIGHAATFSTFTLNVTVAYRIRLTLWSFLVNTFKGFPNSLLIVEIFRLQGFIGINWCWNHFWSILQKHIKFIGICGFSWPGTKCAKGTKLYSSSAQ